MTVWAFLSLNALSFSMLLFVLASGFSLIFGTMRILNMAHGSFYMLGAYLGLTVVRVTGNFWLAILVGGLGGAVAGIAAERFLLRHFRHDELSQVLLTFGCLFVISDLSLWIWGGQTYMLPKPEIFSGSIQVGSFDVASYRLFLVLAGAGIAAGLWLFLERTRLGAAVRAAVDDPEMAQAVGINISIVFAGVFGFGALLAALIGVIGGPVIGMYPGLDVQVLLLALVVVVVGGVGSLQGAFVGSLLVGFLDTFGSSLFPEFVMFTIFAPVAIILAIKPTGLFGRA